MKLAKWFENRIKTVMDHNEYSEDMKTAQECNKRGHWSPCDLIAREYLNNGGGSANGFLGMSKTECKKCYLYMCENRDEIVRLDLVSKEGYNNFGFKLWENYGF